MVVVSRVRRNLRVDNRPDRLLKCGIDFTSDLAVDPKDPRRG